MLLVHVLLCVSMSGPACTGDLKGERGGRSRHAAAASARGERMPLQPKARICLGAGGDLPLHGGFCSGLAFALSSRFCYWAGACLQGVAMDFRPRAGGIRTV